MLHFSEYLRFKNSLRFLTILSVFWFACKSEFIENSDDVNQVRVSTIIAPPYVSYSRSSNSNNNSNNNTNSNNNINNTNGDRFQGFLIDYLDEIAEIANFQYNIREVKDGKFGYLIEDVDNGDVQLNWTGLIGELVRNETDLALGPIVVCVDRLSAVDFTLPFESFQAVVVFKEPYHWSGSSSSSSGSGSGGGSSGSGSGIGGGGGEIKNIEDLLYRERYTFGAVRDGSIHKYLTKFRDNHVQYNLSKFLDKNPLQPVSITDGLTRVTLDTKYAFLVEEPAVRGVVGMQPCELKTLPTNFFKRHYALATRKHSPLRDRINAAMLEIIDTGQHDEMVKKWWNNECSTAAAVISVEMSLGRGGVLYTMLMMVVMMAVMVMMMR